MRGSDAQEEEEVITVRIHEEQGLDSNFATKEVSSGLTGMLIVHMKSGQANYTDKLEQGGDLKNLLATLVQGHEKITEMLKEKA